MSLKSQAIQGSKWSALGSFGKAFMQILQIVVLTRFLTKEEFGLFAISLFVIQLFQILSDFGFNSSMMHQRSISKFQFSSLYFLNLFVAVVLYLLLVSIAPLVSSFYNNELFFKLIALHGLLLLFNAIGKYHRLMLHKTFKFREINIIELGSFFVGLLLAIGLAYTNFGVYSLIFPALLTSLLSNIAFYFSNVSQNTLIFRMKIAEIKPFLRIGGYHMGSSLLDFFSKEIDVMIIGKILGPEILGVYSLIKQLVTKVFSMINPVLINVIIPIFSSIQTDIIRLKKLYKRLLKYLSLVSLPIYSLIIFCSSEILEIMYGAPYAPYALVLSFIALTYYIISIFSSVGSLQIATGRTDLGFRWTIIRFLVTPLVIYAAAQLNLLSVSVSYALLFILFVIPIWKIQLKPMIGIGLIELVSHFIKPFLFIVLILVLKLFLKDIEISAYVWVNLLVKATFLLSLVFCFALVFERDLSAKIIDKIKAYLLKRKSFLG